MPDFYYEMAHSPRASPISPQTHGDFMPVSHRPGRLAQMTVKLKLILLAPPLSIGG